MALPTNADVIVVHGYWLDELTGVGVKQANGLPATIMFDPVPLLGANAAKTPNLRDLTSNAHLKTRTRVASVDPVTGYYAAQLVASNDPDLDAYSGRKVTFLGEDPFTIEVPYNAPTVTVSAEMAAKTGLTQGSNVKAIWLPNASVTTIPTPTPSVNYLSSSQTLANIAAGIETHDEDPAAHADIRALIPAAYTDEQARDALAATLVAGSNVTITPNDGADTITISVSVPSSYSDEQAQDAFAALIAAGTHSGITFAYNDAGNALSATVAAQSWSQITGKPTIPAAYSDLTGTVPQSALPAVALTDFLGAVASQAAMLALTGQRGDWCTRTDRGTDFQLIADTPATLGSWREMTYPASPVSSVNGRTGAVTGLAEASSIPAAYTDEQARDAIGAALVAGTNVTITVNDAADTITIASSGGGTVSDATTTAKGVVQLAGDLGGTAASPTVPGKTALSVDGSFVSTYNLDTTPVTPADIGAQPVDADLTTIAALDSTTAGAMTTDGSGWIRKTYAQLKTALGLVKADVGLGNVDNTSDANKPVSTAQAAADALKADAARTISAGTGLTGGGDLTANRSFAVAYGTTSTTAAVGNDSRLSDARTPTAHTHPVTDLTATGTRDSTTFLRGDNTWATPSGGVTAARAAGLALILGS